MGILDSNKVVVTSQIISASESLDLSSGGNKLTINTKGKNTLCIKYTMTGGAATIKVASFTTYGTALCLYDLSGRIHEKLTDSGVFFADVTGIGTICFYCDKSVASTTATVDYYLANDAPAAITSAKPIQLLKEYDIATSAGTTNYTAWSLSVPKFFKYLFVIALYELNGTEKKCSLAMQLTDAITYDSATRTFNYDLCNIMDSSNFRSGFIENQRVRNDGNVGIRFSSTPVDGAILHLKFYGVR